MRIALCLSGLPRCYNYHPESLLGLFEPHTVDVFMHHWDDDLTDEQKADIQRIWQPRAVVFEPQPRDLFRSWTERTHHLRAAGRPHGNTFPMWYSVHQANELRREWQAQQGWVYDAVCRARTDLWANSSWTVALERIQANQVIVSHERHYDGGYNDTIALGDSASMDLYSGLWSWFPEALAQNRRFGYEVMLRDYLDNCAKLQVLPVPVQIKIMRPQDLGRRYEDVEWNANTPPPDNDLVRA